MRNLIIGLLLSIGNSSLVIAQPIYTPPSGQVVITGGTINNTKIGNITPSSGAFTTLNASGNDALLYQNTSGQAISNNSPTTITNWTEVFDRLGANFNASSGTFTAPVSGYYFVSAGITYAPSTSGVVGDFYQINVRGNGTADCIQQNFTQITTSVSHSASASCIVFLSLGQTIIIQADQNSGNTVDLTSSIASENYVSIDRIP